MEADALKENTEKDPFMLELARKHLPVDDEIASIEENVSRRWPYMVMAIAVSPAIVRILVLGFPG